MKRHLLITAIFLLAGTVVNVAVAWGCALACDPGYISVSAGSARARIWARPHLAAQQSGCVVLEGRAVGVRMQALYEFLPWRWEGRKWPPQRVPTDGVRLANVTADIFQKLADRMQSEGLFILDNLHLTMGHANVVRFSAGLPCQALSRSTVRRYTFFQPPLGVVRSPTMSLPRPIVGVRTNPPMKLGTYGVQLKYRQWAIDGDVPIRPIWPGFAVNTLCYATLLWSPFVLCRVIRVRRGLCPKCAYPMGQSAVCTECGNAIPHNAVA